MKEKKLEDIVKGVLFGSGGRVSLVGEFQMPFNEAVANSFIESGYTEAIKNPQHPPGTLDTTHYRGPIADLGFTPLLISISIFLGTSIGSWIVKKVCDEIYESKMRPALKTLISTYKKKYKRKTYTEMIDIELKIYYEIDDLQIIVRASAASSEELEVIETLIPEAELKALAWIEERGITNKLMVYTIKNGELSNFPKFTLT